MRGRKGGAAALLQGRRLVAVAEQYLRDCFASQEIGAGHVGDFISGLNRLCVLTGASGGLVESEDSSLKPLWRILRSWRLSVPGDFRCLVTQDPCPAVAVRFFVKGPARLSLATLLGFHCMLRPGEACALERSDVTLFAPEVLPRHPGASGIVP